MRRYSRRTEGLYGAPPRVSTVGGSASAPVSHVSAAWLTVIGLGATRFPRYSWLTTSARHCLAAASAPLPLNVCRISLRERRSYTDARIAGVQLQLPPSLRRQVRECAR